MIRNTTRYKVPALLALLLITIQANPYSVQSHEEIIDIAWKNSIVPVILKHFPNLTDAQLNEAHAYAYGGSAIQDFGYYPFGNAFFSNLTHYVRSGDFVLSLIRNSQTADDLAFAIGALSHYIGDTIGHSYATNQAVSIEFPKLARQYGPTVNYAEGPHQHVQTEFAFDINQLSKGRFAPSHYLGHVGLEIPRPLLHTAFYETYGLNLPDIIGSKETSLRTYRRGVRSFIPDIARAETILHKKSLPTDTPSDDLTQLKTELLQISNEDHWQQYKQKPGFTSHLYAGFIYLVPKVGALKMLSIRGPEPQTEELYIHSMSRSVRVLLLVMANYDRIDHYISNRDLDTGANVKPGGYPLTDKTYARLLAELAKRPTRPIPIQLKHDIQAYYADPLAPITTKKNATQWAAVQANLKTLETMKTLGEMDPIPDEIFDSE